jgi:hypothetical protein
MEGLLSPSSGYSTLITACQTIRCHNQQDGNMNLYLCKKELGNHTLVFIQSHCNFISPY